MEQKPEYRFKCEIVDETTGETIASGSTYIGTIDSHGQCESVEVEVASMLRYFDRLGRESHERENYPKEDDNE